MAKNRLNSSDEMMARISLMKRIRKLPIYMSMQRLMKLLSAVLVP